MLPNAGLFLCCNSSSQCTRPWKSQLANATKGGADLADAKGVEALAAEAEGGDVGVADVGDRGLGLVELQGVAGRASGLPGTGGADGVHVGHQALQNGACSLVLLRPLAGADL